MNGTHNIARLNGIARAQRSQCSKNTEDDAQPFPVLPQAVLNVIHGAAYPVSVLVPLPELHRQKHLGILGGHTNQGCHPQPKQCTRSAQGNRRGDSGDVSGANRTGQRRRNRLKRGDLLLPRMGPFENLPNGILHGVAEFPELQPLIPYGHENTDANEQNQHGGPPYKAVHRAVDLCNQFHTLLPFSFLTDCRLFPLNL